MSELYDHNLFGWATRQALPLRDGRLDETPSLRPYDAAQILDGNVLPGTPGPR